MPLDSTGLKWAAAVVAGVAVMAGVVAFLAGVRRRRRHRQLMREVVVRMCTELDTELAPMHQLRRDLVDVLLRQDRAAGALERASGPAGIAAARVALLTAGDPFALVADVFGEAVAGWALAAPADDADETGKADNADETDEAEESGEDGEVDDVEPVPHPDAGELARVEAEMRATVHTQLRLARAVLAVAGPIEPPDDEGLDELYARLDRAADAARRSAELAGAGDVLPALYELSGAEPPLPEAGVPGQRTRPELREQAFALARTALRHREDVLRWCDETDLRCEEPA